MRMNQIFLFLFLLPRKIVVKFISFYQYTLSPDHGMLKGFYPHGYCKFYPSCSEYAKQSIVTFGLIEGMYMGFCRVLRCNPWTEPSVDLPPQSNK